MVCTVVVVVVCTAGTVASGGVTICAFATGAAATSARLSAPPSVAWEIENLRALMAYSLRLARLNVWNQPPSHHPNSSGRRTLLSGLSTALTAAVPMPQNCRGYAVWETAGPNRSGPADIASGS